MPPVFQNWGADRPPQAAPRAWHQILPFEKTCFEAASPSATAPRRKTPGQSISPFRKGPVRAKAGLVEEDGYTSVPARQALVDAHGDRAGALTRTDTAAARCQEALTVTLGFFAMSVRGLDSS